MLGSQTACLCGHSLGKKGCKLGQLSCAGNQRKAAWACSTGCSMARGRSGVLNGAGKMVQGAGGLTEVEKTTVEQQRAAWRRSSAGSAALSPSYGGNAVVVRRHGHARRRRHGGSSS
jgi:hypothetical protein